MVTAIYGIGRFNGAELFLMINALSLLTVLGGAFLFRCNRIPCCRNRLLATVLGAAALCDVLLFLILFPGGDYYNYGIGGAVGVLLYPGIILTAGAIATAYNREEL